MEGRVRSLIKLQLRLNLIVFCPKILISSLNLPLSMGESWVS